MPFEPPDPADWISDRYTSESPDTPREPSQRHEEPLTWDAIRAARDSYEPRHGGATAP
jgi:hypothetical protein